MSPFSHPEGVPGSLPTAVALAGAGTGLSWMSVCAVIVMARRQLFFFFSSFQRDTTSGEEMTILNSLQRLILNGISRDKEEALR